MVEIYVWRHMPEEEKQKRKAGSAPSQYCKLIRYLLKWYGGDICVEAYA
jgi:hypothetical protein